MQARSIYHLCKALSLAAALALPEGALAAVGGGSARSAPHQVYQAAETPTPRTPADQETDPITGMHFVAVPGGSFVMGNPFAEGDRDERPLHEVQLSDFALASYPVTRGQFRSFVRDTGYRTEAEKGGGCYVERDNSWSWDPAASWRNPGFPQDENHPVVCVSWNDASAFAQWLTRKSGRQYRLPTEAEWEFAARSRGRQERFAGFSDPLLFARYGNFCDLNCTAEWRTPEQNDLYRYTAPVGSYLPNGLGLYDMVGNVWQWVADYYDDRYYAESTRKWPLDQLYGGEKRRDQARVNPRGPAEGSYRVLRGGSWNSAPIDARVAQRLRNKPEYRRSYIGFRLAVSSAPRPVGAAQRGHHDKPGAP